MVARKANDPLADAILLTAHAKNGLLDVTDHKQDLTP